MYDSDQTRSGPNWRPFLIFLALTLYARGVTGMAPGPTALVERRGNNELSQILNQSIEPDGGPNMGNRFSYRIYSQTFVLTASPN